MPEYMLDTDTVSLALRGEGRVDNKITSMRPSQISISSITVAELQFGAELRESQKLHRLISTFVDAVQVLPFDQPAAVEFGLIASHLQKKGKSIGNMDALLAAHARSLDLIFVTSNQRHFKRVPGLKTENWK